MNNLIKKRRRLNIPNIIILILMLVIASGIVLFVTFFTGKNTEDQLSKKNTEEALRIVDLVGTHAILPTDEIPNVATVNNPEDLRSNVFFKNAKIGDRLIVYPESRKAILYDPKEDKIIEMGYLGDDASGQPSQIKNDTNK